MSVLKQIINKECCEIKNRLSSPLISLGREKQKIADPKSEESMGEATSASCENTTVN